jgi:anaerobic selenocysteine-containing dehydrogenase
VHLSEKAVEPPGDARSDLDIFLAFAKAMDFRDQDGDPLITWDSPEKAYRAWQRCSAGRPCDYTAIGYEDLRREGGIQWGGDRLYTDGRFPFADPESCETFGRDLLTGGAFEPTEYRATNPRGARCCAPPSTSHPPSRPTTSIPCG